MRLGKVDRIRPIAQSRGLPKGCSGVALKKGLLIVIAIVLGPLLVVRLVRAAGDWRTIGQTVAGDTVSVSSVRVLKWDPLESTCRHASLSIL